MSARERTNRLLVFNVPADLADDDLERVIEDMIGGAIDTGRFDLLEGHDVHLDAVVVPRDVALRTEQALHDAHMYEARDEFGRAAGGGR